MSDDGISERAESLVEKIKDAVHKHSSSSSSSSSDNENDLNLLSHPKKKRLFGRQKPVHAVFGGGKCNNSPPIHSFLLFCFFNLQCLFLMDCSVRFSCFR